jgi:hypothetical protein
MHMTQIRPKAATTNRIQSKQNAQNRVNDEVSTFAAGEAGGDSKHHIKQPTHSEPRMADDIVLSHAKEPEESGREALEVKDSGKGQYHRGEPCITHKVMPATWRYFGFWGFHLKLFLSLIATHWLGRVALLNSDSRFREPDGFRNDSTTQKWPPPAIRDRVILP